jgi:NADH-quinone oxidoreductase subunit C
MTRIVAANPLPLAVIAERLAAVPELSEVRPQPPDTVLARCERAALKELARRLKAEPEAGYETLNWIAGVDRRSHRECVYHLYSWQTNTHLQLYVALPADDDEVETVCDVWPSAEWLEREAWDMFGIRFSGHPDLRRILLRDDFIGHPLRKDYIDSAENHPHV